MELLAAGTLVLAFDQATKRLIVRCLTEGRSVHIGSRIRVRLVTNRGGVLAPVLTKPAVVALWATLIVGVLVLSRYDLFFPGPVARVGLGCALGGATGNLVDRLWRGGVIDFIDLGFWPVFNLADGAILAGAVLALSSFRY
jgi:signal peptidase II